jgi:beta-N-acetylhexosaminidase
VRPAVRRLRIAAAGAVVLAASTAALWSCGRPSAAGEPLPWNAAASAGHAAWVEETLRTMTLEKKIGQLIFPQLRLDADSELLERWVGELGVGGVLVGIGSPAGVAARLNELQTQAEIPLLAAADLEYGAGMRLRALDAHERGGTVLPFPLGIAASADPALAQAAGRVTATEARAAGIHWILAPVADLATEPANPVVNVRSFGADPEAASTFVAAFVRGAEGAGALTAVKHFPGHGATDVDSHEALPRISVERSRLNAVELAPFRAALRAGASAVMPGHLAVPALTGTPSLPVSLSPQALGNVLRRELGHGGLIVSDALDMGALAGFTEEEAAVAAVQAGSDVLLKPTSPDAVHAALLSAVRTQRLPESRIDAAVRRILAAKAKVNLQHERMVNAAALPGVLGSAEHARLADELAARSLVLVRDPAQVLPLDPRRVRSIALIALAGPPDVEVEPLVAALRREYGDVLHTVLDDDATPRQINTAVTLARRADAVLLASLRAPTVGLGPIALPGYAADLARRLGATERPVVVLSFGDPFAPAALLPGAAYLLAWQPRGGAAHQAVARALAGRAAIGGRAPVPLPGVPIHAGLDREPLRFELATLEDAPDGVGMDTDALHAALDRLLSAAIRDAATPGAAVVVGRRGRIVLSKGYGRLDARPGFGAVSDSTIYDIASLTKAVGTTMAVMLLHEEGRLDLDAPLHQYLPEWERGGQKDRVTVRHLLTHTSGLPAYAPLWRELSSRDAYIRRIGAARLEYAPGSRTVYSDFGMILLAAAVERVAGLPLDALLRDRVFGPLGMRETDFDPLRRAAVRATGASDESANAGLVPRGMLLDRIAPTELDRTFRGTHVHGVVQDENAFAMGGVAGHAGLFSSARDLAIFAQLMLNGGVYGDTRLLRPSTIALFSARQPNGRALGWDAPARGSSAGAYFSSASYGHTGFTGTSLWLDPQREVFVVLLTNRVNPTRANQRHVPLRTAVHDAVIRAITDEEVRPRRE